MGQFEFRTRRAGRKWGGWSGRISGVDEDGAASVIAADERYSALEVEFRPRAGRPVGWRKEGATEAAVGTRLTAEQLAWLDAQPGKTRGAKLRDVIAAAMTRP